MRTASVNALAENIAASDAPVLVVAASLNNCVRGEQVVVELQPYKVKQVFKKEEAIASRLVNASLPLNGVKQSHHRLSQGRRAQRRRAGGLASPA